MTKGAIKALIDEIRTAWAKIERVDPESSNYKDLIGWLDRQPNDVLLMLSEAKIKWVSSLARNRCIHRRIL
jgi:hypothetical protein